MFGGWRPRDPLEQRMRALVLTVFLLYPICLQAEYISSELFVINWGDGDNQLKFRPREVVYHDPGGVAPGYDEDPGSGPSDVFVDIEENFVFYSFDNGQIKGFNNQGDVIFDYSYWQPDYKPEFYHNNINGIYVDSHLRLYIVDDRNFVPVIDYEGNLLDSLYPFYPDLSVPILSIYPKYNGDICFYGKDRGFATYSNGEFKPGGTPGFLAANGSYYSIWSYSLHSIEFVKYEDPDISGDTESREYTEIEFPEETIYAAAIYPGGDGSKLYVAVSPDSIGGGEIWELDFDFNLLDKFTHNIWTGDEVWGLSPVIHPNGNIYRFRCLEDGLHVIRWSKE
jgi:hypothetical protein